MYFSYGRISGLKHFFKKIIAPFVSVNFCFGRNPSKIKAMRMISESKGKSSFTS